MTWQVFVTLRVGELKFREIDATPLLCFAFIAGIVALIVKTGM